MKDFKIVAQSLEQNGWTQFTPHYLTWFCPEGFQDSEDCKSQCTNHGRYCTPDPDGSFTSGYNGKDVVVENQRQLCVYRQATKASKPWLWWDYTDLFGDECSMLNNTYDETCAERVFLDVGGADLPGGIATLRDCIGDADAAETCQSSGAKLAPALTGCGRNSVPSAVPNSIRIISEFSRGVVPPGAP